MSNAKQQELCSQLVQREVIYCLSSLISSLAKITLDTQVEDLSYEDLMEIMVKDDYEEPGTEFIRDDADLDQLEEIADNFGDWSDVRETAELEAPNELRPYTLQYTLKDEYGEWSEDMEFQCWAETEAHAEEQCKDAYPGCDVSGLANGSDDEDEWPDRNPEVVALIRTKVEALVDDWEWVGREYNLDPYQREAYEHWIVSDWFARKLQEQGEMVNRDILGLTVWGRCTTGQSISMDGVIETIAANLWPEEWKGEEA
jgi:hypothetical protein